MIAAGAEAKNFYIQSRRRRLKFGFRLHSPSLWGKRVNLLRDERGLPLCAIHNILVCMVVRKGAHGCLDLWILKFEKVFSLSSEFVQNLTHFVPGKCFSNKSFRDTLSMLV